MPNGAVRLRLTEPRSDGNPDQPGLVFDNTLLPAIISPCNKVRCALDCHLTVVA
jgi:hypothetical protein